MDKEIVNKVQNVLEILANQLGQGVDYFWPIFIKQQLLEGYMGVGVAIMLFFIGIILIFTGYKITKKDDDDIFLLVTIAFSCLPFTIGIILFKASAAKIFNPEYYAVQAVMELVK